MITGLVIFSITYLFIGLRQVPRLHIDRPAGALVGAVLMIVTGVLTLDQAFTAVDMRTLLLLLGMMIITVYLRHAGFFELMADRILSLAKTPFQLLLFVSLSAGLLSALFVNDTICLLYTPIVLQAAVHLGVNPVPYLLALATSSNIGSVMTVTGNPQNMLIGIYSKVPYLSFLAALLPVAVIGLAISIGVIRFLYRHEMKAVSFSEKPAVPAYRVNRPLLVKTLAVCAAVLAGFSAGFPYSLVAAAGAVLLLLIGGIRTERILEGVDWTLLLFFSGLFVVMRGVEASGLAGAVISGLGDLASPSSSGSIAGLSLVSAVLSNLVSNVPAVMLLKPLTESLGNGPFFWLTLAMSSTLAGNLTLIGSVANLIVVQQARPRVEIGFMEYFRAGAIITVATIGIGILVLALEVRIAQGAEGGTAYRAEPSGQAAVGTGQGRSGLLNVTVIPRANDAGRRTYSVVLLCNDNQARARGLQGFRPLKSDEAALFVFEKPQTTTFWMGTVSFPIDIIFVREDGFVVEVAPDCEPGSSRFYGSGVPVKWVVETAAGSGIMIGDRVKLNSGVSAFPAACCGELQFGIRKAECGIKICSKRKDLAKVLRGK